MDELYYIYTTYDPDEIVDLLGISSEELVGYLEPYFREYPEKLQVFGLQEQQEEYEDNEF